MKIWQTILLQSGIFTSVFALGAGAGFVACYEKNPKAQAANSAEAETIEEPVFVETPTDKFLNNLVSAKALTGSIDLKINPSASNTNRALSDINLGDIDLSISNLDISIADLDNLKISGDINVKTGSLDIDATVGYFDNTVYLDYEDTHFYLKTEDFNDVLDMLPTFGVNIEIPEEFSNLDIDSLTASLTTMEEYQENNEHYFLFNFSEDITIKFLSNDEYEMVGIELPETEFMGMSLSATSDLHCLEEDIEDMVNPSLKEDAPQYSEFKPAFNLLNGVMNLVNSKKARVNLDLDVDQIKDEGVIDYFSLSGDIDFDINELKVLADLTIDENDRTHNLQAGYQNETVYASYKSINLSIKNQSIQSLVEYISTKISSKDVDGLMDKLGSLSTDVDIDTVLQYVNDLPEFVSNFTLTSSSLSLTIDPAYFEIPVSAFDIEIKFNSEKIESVTINDLSYGGFIVDASLTLDNYVEFNFVNDNYVSIDPALSLIDSVESLIKQNYFGISFTASLADDDETTKDLTMNGLFQFKLKEVENKRKFDCGNGVLNIVDKDDYNHQIIADAKEEGKVLLEYNNKVHAKFDNATVDSIIDLASKLYEEKDDHFMEIFGDLLDDAKATPLNQIIEGDYGLLLETDIITSLDVTPSEVTVGVNGALIGSDDLDITLVIRYDNESLKGLDIYNINFGGKSINLSLNLFDYDTQLVSQYSLDENAHDYIDLSTLSVLLQLGINTSEFNYYHFKGTVGLEILSFIGKEMDFDLQILNDAGHVKVLGHITNVPAIMYACENVTLLNQLTFEREAYFMFDNSGDGLFHICRHDSWGLVSTTNKYVYGKYTTDYFLDNIITIMCKDLLGLGESIVKKINNIEGGEGQIIYEDIIEDYKYDSGEKSYYFAINLAKIALNNDLGTLSLTIYEGGVAGKTDTLNRAVIGMHMNPGVPMDLSLDATLQNDCDVSIAGHDLTFMDNYVANHANDALNAITNG